jgi:hypothetical protein
MCDMVGSDDDLVRSMRPAAEDRGWSNINRVLSGRMIGRSVDTVCDLHCAPGDDEREFLGLTSKPRSTIFRFEPQN